MSSIRLHYLAKDFLQTLTLKALLLTLSGTIFLSGCGIKGDLYQTPEQPVVEKKAEHQNSKIQQPEKTVELNLPASNLVEEKSEQSISEQAPVKVKSNNNVS